jgi:hypothetical protein
MRRRDPITAQRRPGSHFNAKVSSGGVSVAA